MARVDALLTHLRAVGGSDLHLAAGLAPRVRVHGLLQPVQGAEVFTPATLYPLIVEVTDLRARELFAADKEVDFAYGLSGVGRFRVNAFEQENGPAAVFRLIPEHIVPLSALALPKALEKLAHLTSGLVLITGPTGAGKSTTLAGIIDLINTSYTKHIVTVEDPIEFLHTPKLSMFSQREVGKHAPSFASAMRHAIREDADVILVGELREADTIMQALLAAEMGCLVFATLHTNSASKTIDRLIDAFPAEEQGHVRLMLSECLAAVVAQILLPTRDGAGRVPATEVLLKTSAMPTIIRDNNVPMLVSHMQSGRALGMQTMDDCLEQLVKDRVINFDDGLRRAADRQRFEKLRPTSAELG